MKRKYLFVADDPSIHFKTDTWKFFDRSSYTSDSIAMPITEEAKEELLLVIRLHTSILDEISIGELYYVRCFWNAFNKLNDDNATVGSNLLLGVASNLLIEKERTQKYSLAISDTSEFFWRVRESAESYPSVDMTDTNAVEELNRFISLENGAFDITLRELNQLYLYNEHIVHRTDRSNLKDVPEYAKALATLGKIVNECIRRGEAQPIPVFIKYESETKP